MPHDLNFAGSSLIPPLNFIAALVAGFVSVLILVFLVIHFRNKSLSLAHKLREFITWSVITNLCILAFVASIFLPSPQVTEITPATGTKDVDAKSTVVINFDKPVNRRTMEKSITPDVPGVWVFEEPVYSTHLYRKLVFYPDTTLDAGVDYMVKLTEVRNTLQTSKAYDYEFTFSTKDDPVIKKEVAEVVNKTIKLDVPAYIQQHTLSCELAALKMTLAYRGITQSEMDLLNQVGIDNTPHVGGVWGNPYEKFVGNVNGSQMKDGYGVYWGPIERVAKTYGDAKAFQNGNIEMLTSEISNGNPVIIWVYSRGGRPTTWKTPEGIEIFAVSGEHAVVAVGFVGPVNNPEKVIVNDPLVGQIYWSRSLFDTKWATFSQSGVVIYK